jgi:hypothetical protein
LRHPEKRKLLQTKGIHDGREVADPVVKRHRWRTPVRQSAAALIIEDEGVIAGKRFQPVPPYGAARIQLDVTEPMSGARDRRAISDCRPGDAGTVMRSANTNSVIDVVHELSRRIILSIDVGCELLATIGER